MLRGDVEQAQAQTRRVEGNDLLGGTFKRILCAFVKRNCAFVIVRAMEKQAITLLILRRVVKIARPLLRKSAIRRAAQSRYRTGEHGSVITQIEQPQGANYARTRYMKSGIVNQPVVAKHFNKAARQRERGVIDAPIRVHLPRPRAGWRQAVMIKAVERAIVVEGQRGCAEARGVEQSYQIRAGGYRVKQGMGWRGGRRLRDEYHFSRPRPQPAPDPQHARRSLLLGLPAACVHPDRGWGTSANSLCQAGKCPALSGRQAAR